MYFFSLLFSLSHSIVLYLPLFISLSRVAFQFFFLICTQVGLFLNNPPRMTLIEKVHQESLVYQSQQLSTANIGHINS